jgi:hypothetical protein
MKVRIGKYPRWYGPHKFIEPLKYLGVSENTRDRIADFIPNGPFKWFQEVFQNDGGRKIHVEVHEHDCWSADTTLAHIITPVLIKLRELKHGVAWVEHSDVPKEMRKTADDFKDTEYSWSETGCYAPEYWDYVMGEMIWAFQSVLDEDGERETWYTWDENHEKIVNFDKKKYDEYMNRQKNGLILFGKYYRSLWD